MKHFISVLIIFSSFCFYRCEAQPIAKDSLKLLTANGHPMQYFVSLPEGWTNQKSWPILVLLESNVSEYSENILKCIKARNKMPFIIVAPYYVNNNSLGNRDTVRFPYSKKTWEYIKEFGECWFNSEGLRQIVKDVQEKCNGEEKYFLCGFNQAANTVWQVIFQHPEQLKAAAVVTGNYFQNSCLQYQTSFSNDLSKVLLPVTGFNVVVDSPNNVGVSINAEWLQAKKTAEEHGYQKVRQIFIPQKKMNSIFEEVLNYFRDLFFEEKKE